MKTHSYYAIAKNDKFLRFTSGDRPVWTKDINRANQYRLARFAKSANYYGINLDGSRVVKITSTATLVVSEL
jgi:hypothetical protein